MAGAAGCGSSPDRPVTRAPPHIVFLRGGAGAKDLIEVRGLDPAYLSGQAAPADWGLVFEVFVEGAAAAAGGMPPVLGTTRVEEGVLKFEPRFSLSPGLRYRARVRPGPWLPSGEQGTALEEVFALPAPALEKKTVVTQVYPSAGRLPQNQLKFYLHFSGPMRRRQAYENVRLLDASGRQVAAPFLEIGEELWDPSGTRFTLFFDPGRVKRELRPHEDLGPPLEEGRKYALVIDAGWLDAEGAPLKEPFRKEFEVGLPDYAPPDPEKWKIETPAAGGIAPLRVMFPEPLDHALLHRLLRVSGPTGDVLAGEAAVGREEREWSFTPESPWAPGPHRLLVDKLLEDLAGNSVGRPFEVDAARDVTRQVIPETVAVPFEVTAGSGKGQAAK
jgi:hypothetical protein